MSVIQNLRTKYAKIVGGLIGVSLIGFILMDASNGPLASLFGRDTSVATVNGDKIDAKEYQQRLTDYELLVPLYSKGQQLDENTRAQIRQQVLDEMVYEKLTEDAMSKLGVQVTEAELKDLTHGAVPDPMVQQFPYFMDQQSGGFNPQYIAAFEKQVPQIEDANQRQRLTEEWAAVQRFVARGRRIQKYNALLQNSIITPAFVGDAAAMESTKLTSFRFVKVPYATVPDAEVKVTDADLNDYLNAHKAQYTIDEPTRSIDYVSFDITPSGEDTARSLGSLRGLAGEFATVADAGPFVNRNSDVPYVDKYYTKKTFNSPMADTILSRPVGTVVGPFFENGAYVLVRVVDRKDMPDSVKAQHILIATNNGQRDDSAAHKTIDSIRGLAAAGMPFDSLAVKFSDDPGSKEKGGDLGTFGQGMMVPEFNDVAFNGKTGDLKTVKTQFGWHLIKINEQKGFSPATKLAIITKGLQSSQATNDAAYAKAMDFAGKNNTAKAFDAAVGQNGLQKRVAENVRAADFQLTGLGASRDIVRWIWDKKTKVGTVSAPFALDGRYVIAKLSGEQDAGLIKLDAATRPQVEALVKAQKKGALLAKQYANVKSLDAAAAQSKQLVQQADSVSLSNPFAATVGFEPKVIGYAFYDGMKLGAVSPAIKGSEGLFFISPVARFERPMDPMASQGMLMQINMQTRNTLAQQLQLAARKNATIKYNVKNL